MSRYVIRPSRVPHLLRVAAGMSLVALALMMWSLVDPTPAPVLIALSLGQVIGTLSFAIYLSIVVWDLRRRRRADATPEESASLSDLR